MAGRYKQKKKSLFKLIKEELGDSKFHLLRLNEFQQAAFDSPASQKFIFGGNRSGKTFLTVYMLAQLACGKYKMRDNKPKDKYTVWVSCLDYQMFKQTIIPTMEKVIPNKWLTVFPHKNEFRITGPTGIEIRGFLKSADSGRQKYQSASVDLIILDEEHPQAIFKECVARVVDCKGQIINAMTPLLGMTWVYNYSRKYFNVCMPTSANLTLPAEDIEAFKNAIPDEKERRIRLEGEFVDLAGLKFLNEKDLKYLSTTQQDPQRQCKMVDGKLEDDEYGDVWIYDKPRDGEDYGIGIDVATGSGRDHTVATVYKYGTYMFEVARFRSHFISIPETAKIIYNLGKMYNDAMYMVETNGVGIALKQCLEGEYSYNKLPMAINQQTNDWKSSYGYTQTQSARDALLNKARLKIQSERIWIKNAQSVFEWGAFQFLPNKHRFDHLPEYNDDCLFSDALAIQLWEYMPKYEPVVAGEKKKKATKYKTMSEMTFEEDEMFREQNDSNDAEVGPAKVFDPTLRATE